MMGKNASYINEVFKTLQFIKMMPEEETCWEKFHNFLINMNLNRTKVKQ